MEGDGGMDIPSSCRFIGTGTLFQQAPTFTSVGKWHAQQRKMELSRVRIPSVNESYQG
jgi:hypothetical protein